MPTLAALVSLIGFVNARRTPRILDIDVPIRNLPSPLINFTIVQLSDIHVGSTIKRNYVQAIVDRAWAGQHAQAADLSSEALAAPRLNALSDDLNAGSAEGAFDLDVHARGATDGARRSGDLVERPRRCDRHVDVRAHEVGERRSRRVEPREDAAADACRTQLEGLGDLCGAEPRGSACERGAGRGHEAVGPD